MNVRWWVHRILFSRWFTGCGGEGFTEAPNGGIEVCEKRGCH